MFRYVLHLGDRPLMGDQDPDLFWMPGHHCQGIHGAAAGRENVDWFCAEGGDEPMEVVRVLQRRGLRGVVVALAAAGLWGKETRSTL